MMEHTMYKPLGCMMGDTNLPGAFQSLMLCLFYKEVSEGWLSIYLDDLTY